MARAFEDFPVGTRFVSSTYTISAKAIMKFAREFDPQLFHLDESPTSGTIFGGVVASGWQTAAISMRLFVKTMDMSGGIIGLGVDELRWPAAVRPGDELRVEVQIVEARLSKSRPACGIIRYQSLTKNQDRETVQSFFASIMVPTRASASLRDPVGGEGFEPPTNTV
jgi:acyl dehydratase